MEVLEFRVSAAFGPDLSLFGGDERCNGNVGKTRVNMHVLLRLQAASGEHVGVGGVRG